MRKFFGKVWFDFKEYFILLLLLLLSLYFISINDHKITKNFRALAFGSFATLTSFLHDIFSVSNYKIENEMLRRKNAELMISLNLMKEKAAQSEQLTSLLGLKDTLKQTVIPARIVSRSYSSSQGTFTLNAGQNKEIHPGMPVITGDGLVGIVYSVSDDYSIVRTLKNIHLKIVVRELRTRYSGILKWNGDFLVISDLPKTANLKAGDKVVTSELRDRKSVV